MLIDDIKLEVKGGDGGRGAVAFQKVKLMQGPTGGDGGRGGNVYAEGIPDISALKTYASRREVHAENGRNGRGQFLDGRAGEDLVLKVPTGTRITNLSTGYVQEVNIVGERVLLAGGGMGGKGNFKYRSSINTSPTEFQEGLVGDVQSYRLELSLIADVGLVGLPNAGKSSLLNELTRSKSKVANYAFTTLEPNLGAYYELIIADIPGLIEGASEGKGLGVKFLKHIQRTKTLFHLVSAESDDVARDYRVIRAELESYDPELIKKNEHVFLTKSDMADKDELEERRIVLERIAGNVTVISVLESESLERVKSILNSIKSAA
ncbi:MAG: GTPase ObgE [Candidatus Paceibacterota bacterium]